MKRLYITAVIAALAAPALAIAQDEDPPPRRRPPPQALQACAGQEAGASCSFTVRGQSYSGTCTPYQGHLICVPANAPRR